ncbi:uncharacterized protein PHACADRAFT_149364 [Phanerochaete carnosa HHB-10118-sp]|uniref:Uncharacterized protein n=1 Tax=Phanerochaete carnosa (strain HHB-10118-sp) TaxID=650164 RepID=K5W114_PHACS|nr:uncharacterized protein PHACADRAFT_149364 [Phanerochaete carnosa HHB-10118-sp]EKM52584.1 hypothetical protein PHACADRAFT_149364 [Phanerochaete carnosa HHB-10118-sp]
MLSSGPAPFLATSSRYVFFFFTLFSCANASPVSRRDTDPNLTPVSAGLLALGLSLPFVVLALLKYLYLKYRRAHTIHHGPRSSPYGEQILSRSSADVLSEKCSSPLVGLGLDASSASAAFAPPSSLAPTMSRSFWRLDRTTFRAASAKANLSFQGYLVGFLGSPAWEARITVRADTVARCMSLVKSTPGSLHPSTFSPRSTLNRHPSMSPNLSPYFTASGFAPSSVSIGSRARATNLGSLNSKGGTVSSSARTRASTTNDGSLAGRSHISDASGPNSGFGSHRSRRSHHRAASASAPVSSRRGSGSMSKGAPSSSSRSNRQSQSSKHASASLNTHTRSLSLSFLEMGTPELGVLSGATKEENFAKAAERALSIVTAAATTSGARGTLTERAPFLYGPSAREVSKLTFDRSRSIEDCSSVHPGSPPCIPLPSPAPGSYPYSLSSRSLFTTTKKSSMTNDIWSSSSMPHILKPTTNRSVNELGENELPAAGARSEVSPYLTPYYFSPRLVSSPISPNPPPHVSPNLGISSNFSVLSPSPTCRKCIVHFASMYT